MKNLVIILFGLLTFSVNAQFDKTSILIDAQRAALDEQLHEGYIQKMDYDRKIAGLRIKENIQKSLKKSQPKVKSGPGGTASVSGTVQVGGMNQPDVEIYLYEVGTRLYAGGMITDAMGEYNITDLAAGDYFLLANGYNDPYIDAMWSTTGAEQCNNCQPGVSNTITLADAENRTGVDMDMVVGATLSGNATSGASPIMDLRLTLRTTDNQGYYGATFTDASGDYTISGIPAGDYYLLADGYDDIYIDAQWTSMGTVQCLNCEPDPSGTIALMPPNNLMGYDLEMTVGSTISGTISDSITSMGVETLDVTLVNSSDVNNGYFFTQFDGSGNYTIQGVPQGSYQVYLEPNGSVVNEYVPEIYNNIPCNLCSTMVYNGAGDLVVLTNGATTSGIDFSLSKGASIAGAILNASHLPETVEQLGIIYIFNVSNRLVASQFLYGTQYDPMFDGTYKIGGLLPGSYFVQGGDLGREFFQRELYNDIRCPWSGCDRGGGGTAVSLGPNEQRIGINFLLEYGGKISGTVTDLATGQPINSEYTEYVQFYDSMGRVAGGAGIRPDGTYTSQRALPPGTYSVRTGSMFTGDFNAPYVMEKYDPSGNIDCPGVTCDLTLGNVVVPAYARQTPRNPSAEAAAATVTGIDFALSTGFSFSGTITDLSTSDPIPEVHVLVYDDSANFATWATTDAMGDFIVSGLPAGSYYALTNNGSNLPLMGYYPEEVGSWIDILYSNIACPGSACDVTTGTEIVLGPVAHEATNGANPVLDFGLSSGGTITGQVNIMGSQLPASYVNVNVYNAQAEFYGSYPTDEDGHYLTVGLPSGTYYLITSNNGALVDVKYGNEYCNESCNPLDAAPLTITEGNSLVDVDFDLRTDYIFKNGLD